MWHFPLSLYIPWYSQGVISLVQQITWILKYLAQFCSFQQIVAVDDLECYQNSTHLKNIKILKNKTYISRTIEMYNTGHMYTCTISKQGLDKVYINL